MLKLLGKPISESILDRVRKRTELLLQKTGRSPQLAVVLVGTDPASVIYTRKKGETALSLGMKHQTIQLPATSTPQEVKVVVEGLNRDPNVDGILIQRPLPKSFREEEVVYWVSPEKDVDAFHPENAGRMYLGLNCFQPCTPSGVMALLKHYKIQTSGRIACIVGRSAIVGKPMATLLLQSDATVLHCHSKTPDLRSWTRQAEILVVAAGKMHLIDETYVRPGAVVIDVGIHRNAEGKLMGDVQFDRVAPIASAVTPVPGGVGPLTIALLMENTVTAAERSV